MYPPLHGSSKKNSWGRRLGDIDAPPHTLKQIAPTFLARAPHPLMPRSPEIPKTFGAVVWHQRGRFPFHNSALQTIMCVLFTAVSLAMAAPTSTTEGVRPFRERTVENMHEHVSPIKDSHWGPPTPRPPLHQRAPLNLAVSRPRY